jgi:class 3 adenylate cyclase/pimeloyl-ACP methyl ester carboxylesterase
MTQELRYCTSADGVQIAFSVEGAGPALVICPYFFETFARDEDGLPTWPMLIRRMGAGRQLIRYDMRGTGLSQREGVEISHQANVNDLAAVVQAAGLTRFDLLGWAISGPTVIEYAASHQDQVERVILYSTFLRPTDVMPEEALRGLAALCRTNWQMAAQTFTDMSMRQEAPDLAMHQASIMREAMSGDILASNLELDYDLTEEARSIRIPTLVLHRVTEVAIPFASSQRLASLIPNARLAPLKGTINYPALGDWQSIADAINTFLKEGREPEAEREEPGAFRTILFTDLVGHTAMMQRLGDEAGRRVLREHERITREALRAHGGSEVKTMGDGFMASFASATGGLDCAIALQRAFARDSESSGEPIRVRVGLNAGEPIAEDDDLFGTAVILAARIAAQADAGEILVSEAVRQIVAGKHFLFSDRGETALRGFEDPVRVYEVNWRE